MSNYHYQSPLDKGYKQFKLTKKQHNELFPYRKIDWREYCEYYYNDNGIITHKFTSKLVIFVSIILSPVIVLLHGIANIKDIWGEFTRLLNEKKYGSFVSDHVPKNTDKYNEIIKLIKDVDKC